MRKLFAVVFALSLLFTPHADAKICYGISCNYIDTNWSFSSGFADWGVIGSPTTATGNCYSSTMAIFDNTEGVSRQFYVDNAYTSYKVQFRAWLVGDADNFYDELRIRVTNNTTGYSELHTLHGSSYTNHCGNNVIYLSGDYDYANVTVTFTSGNFSIRQWQIDDPAFFAVF